MSFPLPRLLVSLRHSFAPFSVSVASFWNVCADSIDRRFPVALSEKSDRAVDVRTDLVGLSGDPVDVEQSVSPQIMCCPGSIGEAVGTVAKECDQPFIGKHEHADSPADKRFSLTASTSALPGRGSPYCFVF